ncbi:unnamed protein product [Adineta ricciae]|uniref:Uncharacterized protein n=1 Tax=Adineta ricciae TaxID=249248 RepID=A0A813PMU4_ADIRI|nr:unnamed protein product [Adineta ricciae]
MEVDPPPDTTDPPTNSPNTNEQSKPDDEQEDEEFLIMADIGHDIDQQTVLEHATKSEIHAIDIDVRRRRTSMTMPARATELKRQQRQVMEMETI